MDIKKLVTSLGGYDPARAEKTEADNRARRLAKATVEPRKGDTVSLSEDARLRTDAYSAAMGSGDIRHDKVAEIKARIAAGEYVIDTRKIAQKVVAEDIEFFGR